jgi:hypothetical protein
MTQGNPTKPAADAAMIRQTLGVLFEPGDVVELRAFKSKRCTISGYYNDQAKLVVDAAMVNRVAGTVYVTLNRIDPSLLVRRAQATGPQPTAGRDGRGLRRPRGPWESQTEGDHAHENRYGIHRPHRPYAPHIGKTRV